MNEIHSQNQLLLSLQRALLGNVDSDLRQASVEADIVRKIVKIRFEHSRAIRDYAKERLSVAASEVIADFPSPWSLDEQYSAAPTLTPLMHVAYRRFEQEDDQ